MYVVFDEDDDEARAEQRRERRRQNRTERAAEKRTLAFSLHFLGPLSFPLLCLDSLPLACVQEPTQKLLAAVSNRYCSNAQTTNKRFFAVDISRPQPSLELANNSNCMPSSHDHELAMSCRSGRARLHGANFEVVNNWAVYRKTKKLESYRTAEVEIEQMSGRMRDFMSNSLHPPGPNPGCDHPPSADLSCRRCISGE